MSLIYNANDVDLEELALYLHALARGIENEEVFVTRVGDMYDADAGEMFRRTLGMQFSLTTDAEPVLYNPSVQLEGGE